MIEAKGLSKNYGAVQALRDVSFRVADNEVVGLLGHNGAGKTTLMKLLSGYLHPTEGSATIDDIVVEQQPLQAQSRLGYLPENAPVYREMAVQEYLQMIADLRQIPVERSAALISDAVRRTGLQGYLVRPIAELSKGYRQRVGLAQAILHNPQVLILDEPTSGLDPSQIVEIRQLLKELAKNATVLLSTHILSEVELSCERVLIISDGQLLTDARLSELRTGSTAVVALDAPESEVGPALREIDGVSAVIKSANGGSFSRYRVTAAGDDICPTIYDVARKRGWRMAELRHDEQTLESVFRNVVERGGVA